jgi:inosose dehydratase
VNAQQSGRLPGLRAGSAPDSWGVWFPDDPLQTPWQRFLDEIAETGYHWTELGPYGYLPSDSRELERELSSRGLGLTSGFTMFDLEQPGAWEAAKASTEQVSQLLKTLGSEYLIVIDDVYTDLTTGVPRYPAELDDGAWTRLVDTTKRIMEVADRHGLQTVFHPHAQTHVEREHQIERLLADADGLGLCFDVGHHAYCGGEPVAFYRRHAERIPYLHLKSVDLEHRDRVERDGTPFAQAVKDGVFVEPSEGAVDFPALRDALVEHQFSGFAIVEQDMYPTAFDRPLPIAKRTREYLSQLGLA